MCGVSRNPSLHYLALGQFQCSCPKLNILFGNLQSDGHNTDFSPSVILVQGTP